jgi:uncharacterized membrane protein
VNVLSDLNCEVGKKDPLSIVMVGLSLYDLAMSTPQQHHPAVESHLRQREQDIQLRVADAITKFAGSMMFVYVHIIVFAVWMLLIEKSPWPTLTLIVSLEAIFLSTFVMIGQNRQASFAQVKADHDFVAQEQELKSNTDLTREVHAMTKEMHAKLGLTQEK